MIVELLSLGVTDVEAEEEEGKGEEGYRVCLKAMMKRLMTNIAITTTTTINTIKNKKICKSIIQMAMSMNMGEMGTMSGSGGIHYSVVHRRRVMVLLLRKMLRGR
jgi:hypothetical protein